MEIFEAAWQRTLRREVRKDKKLELTETVKVIEYTNEMKSKVTKELNIVIKKKTAGKKAKKDKKSGK